MKSTHGTPQMFIMLNSNSISVKLGIGERFPPTSCRGSWVGGLRWWGWCMELGGSWGDDPRGLGSNSDGSSHPHPFFSPRISDSLRATQHVRSKQAWDHSSTPLSCSLCVEAWSHRNTGRYFFTRCLALLWANHGKDAYLQNGNPSVPDSSACLRGASETTVRKCFFKGRFWYPFG